MSGTPAYAPQATAAVMPGTTSNAMPCAREELEFLAAAPEDERIAALEPHDTATEARMLEHELVDALLRRGMTARLLADADARGIAARECEHLLRHEAVVQDDVRLLQRAQRIQRQQARISGPGTDQRDRAGEWLRRALPAVAPASARPLPHGRRARCRATSPRTSDS